VNVPLGIHTHNDAGVGVANALAAVDCGCVHVQGTVNGYGERTGNGDLIQIIPNLELKYGKHCLRKGKLVHLTELAHYVAEMTNQIPDQRQPFVGQSSFAHKGGIHVSAVRRHKSTYEHIQPELVGNKTRVLVSDQSGQSNIYSKAEELGMDLDNASQGVKDVVARIKRLENEGYEFEAAEGSFEVLTKKVLGRHRSFFDLDGFRVIVEKRASDSECISEATVKIKIDGEPHYVVAEGDGPVNALDQALRKALRWKYPKIRDCHLTDFKVRILDPKSATAAKTRVLIQSTDNELNWGTVGVSENIIEAAWRALIDSIEYKLLKDEELAAKKRRAKKKAAKRSTKPAK
jgi:2-isopropylmalate synthase